MPSFEMVRSVWILCSAFLSAAVVGLARGEDLLQVPNWAGQNGVLLSAVPIADTL